MTELALDEDGNGKTLSVQREHSITDWSFSGDGIDEQDFRTSLNSLNDISVVGQGSSTILGNDEGGEMGAASGIDSSIGSGVCVDIESLPNRHGWRNNNEGSFVLGEETHGSAAIQRQTSHPPTDNDAQIPTTEGDSVPSIDFEDYEIDNFNAAQDSESHDIDQIFESQNQLSRNNRDLPSNFVAPLERRDTQLDRNVEARGNEFQIESLENADFCHGAYKNSDWNLPDKKQILAGDIAESKHTPKKNSAVGEVFTDNSTENTTFVSGIFQNMQQDHKKCFGGSTQTKPSNDGIAFRAAPFASLVDRPVNAVSVSSEQSADIVGGGMRPYGCGSPSSTTNSKTSADDTITSNLSSPQLKGLDVTGISSFGRTPLFSGQFQTINEVKHSVECNIGAGTSVQNLDKSSQLPTTQFYGSSDMSNINQASVLSHNYNCFTTQQNVTSPSYTANAGASSEEILQSFWTLSRNNAVNPVGGNNTKNNPPHVFNNNAIGQKQKPNENEKFHDSTRLPNTSPPGKNAQDEISSNVVDVGLNSDSEPQPVIKRKRGRPRKPKPVKKKPKPKKNLLENISMGFFSGQTVDLDDIGSNSTMNDIHNRKRGPRKPKVDLLKHVTMGFFSSAVSPETSDDERSQKRREISGSDRREFSDAIKPLYDWAPVFTEQTRVATEYGLPVILPAAAVGFKFSSQGVAYSVFLPVVHTLEVALTNWGPETKKYRFSYAPISPLWHIIFDAMLSLPLAVMMLIYPEHFGPYSFYLSIYIFCNEYVHWAYAYKDIVLKRKQKIT